MKCGALRRVCVMSRQLECASEGGEVALAACSGMLNQCSMGVGVMTPNLISFIAQRAITPQGCYSVLVSLQHLPLNAVYIIQI